MSFPDKPLNCEGPVKAGTGSYIQGLPTAYVIHALQWVKPYKRKLQQQQQKNDTKFNYLANNYGV